MARILGILAVLVLLPVSVVMHVWLYLYLATVTGYHEWRDLRNVQEFRTSSGRTFRAEIEKHLRDVGWQDPVTWKSACYGSVATVLACVESDGSSTCVVVDYDHHGTLLSGNPPARE